LHLEPEGWRGEDHDRHQSCGEPRCSRALDAPDRHGPPAGSGLGIKSGNLETTVYDCLIEARPIPELVQATELRYLEIVPASPDLTGAEVELVSMERREFRLREALGGVVDRYEYVIIDCPPSLGLLTLNALTAADSVLIPLQCEYYALEGLSQLMHTIELVRSGLNPSLSIEGILLTMFDQRANISHQVADDVRSYFPDLVFRSMVPRNVRLSECPSFGKPILLYDIKSKGCESYLALANEIMRRNKARAGAQIVA
jgi:chromosome partitioning protein